jgi:hypothetical protein
MTETILLALLKPIFHGSHLSGLGARTLGVSPALRELMNASGKVKIKNSGLYLYALNNPTGGNTPKIEHILPGQGPVISYSHDATGNVLANGSLPFAYGDDNRLSCLGKPETCTNLQYDGRGFLSRSTVPVLPPGLYTDSTVPTYSSEQHRPPPWTR